MRAFVRMREMIAQNNEIAKKLDALERRIDSQDETIVEIPERSASLGGGARSAEKRLAALI